VFWVASISIVLENTGMSILGYTGIYFEYRNTVARNEHSISSARHAPEIMDARDKLGIACSMDADC